MSTLKHCIFQVVRVAVFAEGSEAQEALAAGADVVGADDLVDRIKDSKSYCCAVHSIHVLHVLLKQFSSSVSLNLFVFCKCAGSWT